MDTEHEKNIITLVLMLILTGLGYMAQTIVTTSFDGMINDFHISSTMVQWVLTSYVLTIGVMIPPTAYLTHKFSTKTLILSASLIFTIGSIMSFLASNFSLLIIGRILEAAATGILFPILQISIYKIVEKDKWAVTMGVAGMTIGVAPALGPTLGGLLVDFSGWRLIFEVLTVLGILITTLICLFAEKLIETEDYPLDLLSIILSVIACTGIMFGVSNISINLNYALVFIPLIIGLICLGLFVYRQKQLKKPLLNLTSLKNKYFVVGTLIISIMNFLLIGIMAIYPIFAQNIKGFNATTSGLILLPGSIAMIILSLFGPSWAEKYGIRKISFISTILLIVGSFPMIFFNMTTTALTMAICQILRCAGVGLGMMAIINWSLSIVMADIEDATAINNTIKQIIAASGSVVLTVIMSFVANGTIAHNNISIFAFDITSLVVTILCFVTLFLTIFFIKDKEKITTV
ncbi:MFS transporter [Methanobrevibacter sp. UBA412]|jgi:EmrB/QacA subfamily drug resistance transporter|uniref:MFS transporter n=1 Tax=Methanobrevibacter sp. UBA412 TaxID=1915486 RepID=UPI0039B8AF27